MWISGPSHCAMTVRGDDGRAAFRVRHEDSGGHAAVPFARSDDAARAADLLNKRIPMDGVDDPDEARRLLFAEFGGRAQLRQFLIENACQW